MQYEMLKDIINIVFSTIIKTYNIRHFSIDVKTNTITYPNPESILPNVQSYIDYVIEKFFDLVDNIPLYRIYNKYIEEVDQFSKLMREIFDDKSWDAQQWLNESSPKQLLSSLDGLNIEFSDDCSILPLDDEIVKYTIYQLIAFYLYKNPHIKMEINTITKRNEYYLSNEPTSILLMQNKMTNSSLIFNRWVYINTSVVMDVVNFVTTATIPNGLVVKFDPKSGNELYEIWFGRFIC